LRECRLDLSIDRFDELVAPRIERVDLALGLGDR